MNSSEIMKLVVYLGLILVVLAALSFTVYCVVAGYQLFPITCGALLTAGFGFFAYLKIVKKL